MYWDVKLIVDILNLVLVCQDVNVIVDILNLWHVHTVKWNLRYFYGMLHFYVLVDVLKLWHVDVHVKVLEYWYGFILLNYFRDVGNLFAIVRYVVYATPSFLMNDIRLVDTIFSIWRCVDIYVVVILSTSFLMNDFSDVDTHFALMRYVILDVVANSERCRCIAAVPYGC